MYIYIIDYYTHYMFIAFVHCGNTWKHAHCQPASAGHFVVVPFANIISFVVKLWWMSNSTHFQYIE